MSGRKDGFADRLEHFGKLRELADESRRTGEPVPPLEERAVKPFADPVQNVIEYTTRDREYHHPFNYRNTKVVAFCNDPSNSGLELNPTNNLDGRTNEDPQPGDYIELTEKDPIVRVVVIGSACTPPGYVTVEAEPCDGFRRPDEVVELMPLRFKIDNLWGTHVRGDCWIKPNENGGKPLPENFVKNWPYCSLTDFPPRHVYTGVTGHNYPLAGMSCAIFEIPASKKIRVSGGAQLYGWTGDHAHGDCHYSFRMIRTTVLRSYEAVTDE